VPVIFALFAELGSRLEQTCSFRNVWSMLANAAPWFVGAAFGREVLFSFHAGSHPFLVVRLRIEPRGGLPRLGE
jgi:hypothetical protein